MKVTNNEFLISPSDLVTLYKCDLAFSRSYMVATSQLKRPQLDEFQELLFALGQSHEVEVKSVLESTYEVVEVPRPSADIPSIASARDETLDAMKREVDVIYQGTLFADGIVGYPDFLMKVKDSETDRISYEPIDAKSAKSAKVEAIIQTATYSHLLERMGMTLPSHFHLWLGTHDRESFETSRFTPIVKQLIGRAQDALQGIVQAESRSWADKRTACEQCEWKTMCEDGREQARDLSLVQGMRSDAMTKLREFGITTIDQLATATEKPSKLSQSMFAKLQSQAALQIQAEQSGSSTPEFEVKNAKVLHQIPAPSFGDVYFDIEGNPLANSGNGLEYLLGVWFRDETGTFMFKYWWAENSVDEKKAFEDFIDWVMQRRTTHPDLHIYHYADYERAALRRLAGRHNTRILEVDTLLKNGVLFDYYATVRSGLRISTRTLSIKDVESVYGEKHSGEVSSAVGSVIQFNHYLAELALDPSKAEATKENILRYNEQDIVSLQKLNDWIRAIELDVDIPDQVPGQNKQTEEVQPSPLYSDLMSYVSEDPDSRDVSQRAISMVAALVEFQQREEKPVWWEFFDYAEGEYEDWGTDGKGLLIQKVEIERNWHVEKDSTVRYLKLFFDTTNASNILGSNIVLIYNYQNGKRSSLTKFGRSYFPTSLGNTRIVIDSKDNWLLVRETAGRNKNGENPNTWEDTPHGAISFNIVPSAKITERLTQIAREVLTNLQNHQQPFERSSWSNLLLTGLGSHGGTVYVSSESSTEDVLRELLEGENFTLGVQGPPGTGKTYVGARVIARLVQEHGWNVAICSQSNAAIENLLSEIHTVDQNIPLGKESAKHTLPFHVDDTGTWIRDQRSGCVVGATIFKLTSRHSGDTFDLVVIEEAGQFSLAHSIAALSFGRRGLLLGDPQQLPQVSQGFHPEPVHESALTHLLQNEHVIPPHLGYFLDTSYRMHPEVTQVVSTLQYRGKLKSDMTTEARHLEGIKPGLHAIAIAHSGNRVESVEESQQVLQIVQNLIGREWKKESEAEPLPLTEDDIIIVTPYNAQRRLIELTLQKSGYPKIRVGTVDKFQGQEAAVVIISLAASSDAELPRGLDFLFSPNRLNVAISRAQWCAYLVYSEELINLTPSTPRGLEAYGGFLGVVRG